MMYGIYGVGGLAGENSGIIYQSYSAGNVTGAGYYTGGLLGYGIPNSSIIDSYSISKVSGIPNYGVGGLVGYTQGTVTNSYFTDNTYGLKSDGTPNIPEGVGTYEPAGAAAFRFPSHPVYVDWDFGSIWTIVGGLPQLIWQQ